MMFLTIIILVVIMFFLAIRSFSNQKFRSNPYPLPPGPTPLPFIGCTIQMLLNRPTFRWIDKLMDQFDTPILCIRLGPSTHVIAVSSPDLVCEILKKQDETFISRPDVLSAYQISGGYLSAGFAPVGEQWRKMKTFVNREIVSLPMHKWLQPKRDEVADQVLRYVCNQIKKQDAIVNGGLINVRAVSRHFFGNLMRNMVFGTTFFGQGMEDGGPGVEETEHVAGHFTMIKNLYAFCITDYFPWLRGKIDFDGHEKNMRNAIEIVRKYQDPLIHERIQMWNSGARREKSDLLDAFINHENPKFTPEEITFQIIELMLGALDNPSNIIEWTIGEMIKEPMILKSAVEELDHVVGHHRLVEEQDIPKLNYIKACIKETLRLHPFAPFLPPHLSTINTTVGGYFIPKGSYVIVCRLRLGRNPNVWTDPLRYDPNRHLCGQGTHVGLLDNELRMVPFSTGRRGCPAMLLGTTMTTMMLARMVQGFTWEVPCNKQSIELVKNHNDLKMAKPLMAIAKPRLPPYIYPKY